jgi:hypothetical protein
MKITGDRKRKSKFDPDLANRVNKEYENMPAPELQGNGLPKGENGLLVALGSELYAVDNRNRYRILQRSGNIWALGCLSDGTVYDGGNYQGVYDTAKNELEYNHGPITALAAMGQELLFATGKDIRKTIQNHIPMNDKIKSMETGTSIDAIAVFNDKVYYSSCFGAIIDNDGLCQISNLDDRITTFREKRVYALGVHNGILYDGGHNIYETPGMKIAERRQIVRSLVSHNGILLDAGNYGCVFDTLNDPKGENPLMDFGMFVGQMLSVRMNVWESFAGKGKREK